MTQFDDTFNKEKMDEMRRKEEENLIKALASQRGLPFINLRGLTLNPDAIKLISEKKARSGNMIIFDTVRKRISVAIRNPNNPNTEKILKSLRERGYELAIYLTSTTSLEHGWDRYKDYKHTTAVKHGVLDIDTDVIAQQIKNFRTPTDVSDYILKIRTLNNARRVSSTLESVFAGAIALGASDVHIEPKSDRIRLRYRLDGVLHDVIDLEQHLYDRIVSRLKLLSGMILNIKNKAQDGRFTFTISDHNIEVRSSIIPGASGESMVMRLLDPSIASFKMENLGLNSVLKKVIIEELKRPNGMIITTGPTGSGKTTALYAFLQEVHKPGIKIITIENPVEYKLDDIVQTQTSSNYSFESGLRAILRQDPDVIMVGEIRDGEVATTAIHAAQTGHLVFSTLHTNSAVGAFNRLIDMGVDPRMISSSVNLILGQRLVRILCKYCKKEHSPTKEEAEIITKILATHPSPPSLPKDFVVYEAVGCKKCNQTGFTGRQGVYEAIRVDEKVEEAIINDPRQHIISKSTKEQKIPSMAEDGIIKVISGVTSLTELRRVIDITSNLNMTTPITPSDSEDFSSHIV